jgi:hypothetical protein
MRNYAAFALILGLCCLPGLAQTSSSTTDNSDGPIRGDVAVGYSYVHLTNGGQAQSFNGGSLSGAYNFTQFVAAAADFDFAHANLYGVGENIMTYTAGPRFFYRDGRFTPFAEFLFGEGTTSASAYGSSVASTNFTFTMLGGMDYTLNKKGSFAVRPEVAYVHVNSSPVTSGVHLGVGIAYHF